MVWKNDSWYTLGQSQLFVMKAIAASRGVLFILFFAK
jgi:hypothetical protein